MTRWQFTTGGLPEYHATTLMVKARSGFATALASAAGGGGLPGAARPGVELLARMASFGAVRRITSLARGVAGQPPISPAPSAAGGPFAAALAAWAHASSERGIRKRGARALAGAALVELDSASSADEICTRLRDDPTIASATLVPARYLLATAARRPAARRPRRGRRAASPAAALPAALPPAGAPMWNLRAIRLAEARGRNGFVEANGVRVAVLDTGVEAEHPDLAGRVAAYHHDHPHRAGVVGPEDIVGHGTHVAGTIAADATNAVGVEGICRPALHVWKIFSDETLLVGRLQPYFAYVVDPALYQRALADCADDGLAVVNLSIGGPAPPDAVERELFDALLESGTTVVAAMGNEREWGSPTSYPAAIPGVVAVGATRLDDSVAAFSSRGSHVTLAAPGAAIWSTLPTYAGRTGFEAVRDDGGGWREGRPFRRDTDYDAWDGTSMAAPHVAAAVALYVAKHGPQPPHVVKAALMAAADKVAGMGGAAFHPDFGAGRLNLERLL